MLDKSKIRVCVVDVDKLNDDPYDMSDREFEEMAEVVGAIYSLDVFEDMFNDCVVDTDHDMIRFIGG